MDIMAHGMLPGRAGRKPKLSRYSALMPPSLTTRSHFAISATM